MVIADWKKGKLIPIYQEKETFSLQQRLKATEDLKSYTTYHIWKRYPQYLQKQFWKEHTFWRDGYFACSVGNVSEEMLKRYIGNQG